ncbi:MAG: trypsin-like peptidase domain-containing protein [Candidatus Staskawiczbacteria bacterium]|jgi:serine protease Do
MYDLPKIPKFNLKKFNKKFIKKIKNTKFWGILIIVSMGCVIGFSAGTVALHYFPLQTQAFLQYFKLPEKSIKVEEKPISDLYISKVAYEQAIIDAAKNVSPSVVSIIVSKKLPEYQEVGAGSGFIVTADGLVLTNKHVVLDKKADYTVVTNNGKKYKAKVLALDPVQDLALIKITSEDDNILFQPVKLGNSSGIQIGQSAIAIGNALGEFSNTVSVGVISGLKRTISASDNTGSFSETLEGIIQTDAAINTGNSGGPLLNLNGEVIGINTAMAEGAEAIGFAIPINMAKRSIDQVIKTNKIVYPFVGVRYVLIDEDIKKEKKLSVDYGALVIKGDNGEPAITKGSPAQKAGIKEKDILLQINGEKITLDNSVVVILQKYNVGDEITIHLLRPAKLAGTAGQEIDIILKLAERAP